LREREYRPGDGVWRATGGFGGKKNSLLFQICYQCLGICTRNADIQYKWNGICRAVDTYAGVTPESIPQGSIQLPDRFQFFLNTFCRKLQRFCSGGN